MGRFLYGRLLPQGQQDGAQRAAGVQGGAAVGLRPAPPSADDAKALLDRGPSASVRQRASQVASSQRLGFAVDGGMSFQVRELGPRDRRLEVKELKNPADLREVARVQARSWRGRTPGRGAGGRRRPPAGRVERGGALLPAHPGLRPGLRRPGAPHWKRFVGNRADLEHCEKWATEST